MCPYILDVQMQEHIENLPKRRRLNDAEEQEVLQMLEMRGNKWLIHQHIIKSTGKMQFLIHFFTRPTCSVFATATWLGVHVF